MHAVLGIEPGSPGCALSGISSPEVLAYHLLFVSTFLLFSLILTYSVSCNIAITFHFLTKNEN